MEILEIYENKKEYLPLLLLADEQESMIDKYLPEGRMFILKYNGKVKAECVITGFASGLIGCLVAYLITFPINFIINIPLFTIQQTRLPFSSITLHNKAG